MESYIRDLRLVFEFRRRGDSIEDINFEPSHVIPLIPPDP